MQKSVPDDIASFFKERDDELSPKQGPSCTCKIILRQILENIPSYPITYIYIMNIFLCEFDR